MGKKQIIDTKESKKIDAILDKMTNAIGIYPCAYEDDGCLTIQLKKNFKNNDDLNKALYAAIMEAQYNSKKRHKVKRLELIHSKRKYKFKIDSQTLSMTNVNKLVGKIKKPREC
jgi:hypothetical protein